MRITEIYGGEQLPISFEIFPPKGELRVEELRAMLDGISGVNPSFVSVTCSAGGSGNRGNTAKLAGIVQNVYGVPAMAHLTCMGSAVEDIERDVAAIRAQGLCNVLALRGDKVEGAGESAFSHASELIEYLRRTTDFCLGAGCYPEGHVACESPEKDIEYLRMKEDAGADFFVSQLFFDNGAFYRFVDMARAKGVTRPIEAGIMPFMKKSQITRMIFLCGASLPAKVVRLLWRYENDEESLVKAGLEYAAEQLLDIAQSGAADGVHLYCMNRPGVAVYETGVLRSAGF